MKSDLVLISSDPAHLKRFETLASNLEVGLKTFATADEAAENESLLATTELVFLSGVDSKKDADLAGRVQAAKYAAPEAWMIVIAGKQLKAESAQFLKKSGARFVLLENEYLDSSKPEFVCSQRINGQWIPFKGAELKVGLSVPMNLYHFMPLNKKFMPFLNAGSAPDATKHEKALKVGELYFKREDILLFHEYIKSNTDQSAAGLTARCRQQYLAMSLVYKDLVLLLTDQSEAASFQAGKELLDRCRTLADDFITSLASVGEAWQVVNNAGFDDLSPIDRAPAIAASASLMSLLSGIGNPTDIFLAALLADVGLLDLPGKALPVWRKGALSDFKGEDLDIYQRHPVLSLHRVLARKIPLDESIKNIIQCTHERVDGKGFPNKPEKEDIPAEAMLIQFAEMMDRDLKVDFGRERQDPAAVRAQVLKREKQALGTFSLEFLVNIQKTLGISN